ncbi:MAG: ethanolamine ammonia-lyase small subunit EutC, partial [Actinomycetota bacterium]
MNDVAPHEPWTLLRRATPARVGLGRAGSSLPTAELLAFRSDHLRAREAVLAEFDEGALVADLEARGVEVVISATTAVDRSDYLRHPGRGRRLDDRSRATLTGLRRSGRPWDVAVIVSDGLSHQAAARNAGQVVATALGCLPEHLDVAPVVVLPRARVGVLDDVGASLAARLAVIL